MPIDSNYFYFCGTGHIYQFTGACFLCSGTCGQERQNIQDVQIPKYVYGCRSTEGGADEGQQARGRQDVQDGFRSPCDRQQDSSGWHEEDRHW